MNSYTTGDLERILDEAGVQVGDTVFVHSALFLLGRLRHVRVQEIPEALTETLRGYLGPRGTLVVPSFNFGFCRGKPFDRQRTPTEMMGPLAEYVRQLPESVRSAHPIQSVVAVGRQAAPLCSADTASPFDEQGPFGYMVRNAAKLVQLGGTTISLVHYAEERTGVPYRFWKAFTGTYVDQGREETRTYWMYARHIDESTLPCFDSVLEAMRQVGTLLERPLGSGAVRVFGFQEFVNEALVQLEENPYALIKGPFPVSAENV